MHDGNLQNIVADTLELWSSRGHMLSHELLKRYTGRMQRKSSVSIATDYTFINEYIGYWKSWTIGVW